MQLVNIDAPEQYSIDWAHEYDFQQIGDSDTLFINKWYMVF